MLVVVPLLVDQLQVEVDLLGAVGEKADGLVFFAELVSTSVF